MMFAISIGVAATFGVVLAAEESFPSDDSTLLQVGKATTEELDDLEMYCPSKNDLVGATAQKIWNQGWRETGPNGVNTKFAVNLLGGYIEFEMNISKTLIGVNNNVYGVFPTWRGVYDDQNDYCDGQPATQLYCTELDFIENNGPVAFATTLHTAPQNNIGCGPSGCAYDGFFKPPTEYAASCNAQQSCIDTSKPFLYRASFNLQGEMSVSMSQEGQWLNISQENNDFVQQDATGPYYPDSLDRSAVRNNMIEKGMILKSTQWTGWVPSNASCPSFNPNAAESTFEVRKLVFRGKIVQGSARKCKQDPRSQAPQSPQEKKE